MFSIRVSLFIFLVLLPFYSWSAYPSDNKRINSNTNLEEKVNHRISTLEKELNDAKIRDSGIRDKIQQDEKDFYHAAMSSFNNIITTISIIIALIGITGLLSIRNVKAKLDEAQTEWASIKQKSESVNHNLQSEMKEKLKYLDNQTTALNEFLLGRDLITNPEVDEQTIRYCALPYFEKCKDLWPEFDLATIYISIAYKQIGMFDEAYGCLESYSKVGLTTVGVAHLYEGAILVENAAAIEKVGKQHREQLSTFGGGRFLPFMEALIHFGRKDSGKVIEIVAAQQKEISSIATYEKRKHLHWSFGPSKLYLQQRKEYSGYEELIRHIDFLDGVVGCET